MASITDQNWVVWNQGKNPLVNFNFMLRVELMFDLPCKSVRAFERELEYDFIQEGGLNDYVHMRRKPISKPFTLEVERYVGVDYIDPMPLGADLVLPVMLFVGRNHDQFIPGVVARTYVFTGCTVMKKTYGDLVADQSGLLVETTTLGYREMLCVDIPWSEVGDNIPKDVKFTPAKPTDAKTLDRSADDYKALAQQLYDQALAAKTASDTEFQEAEAEKLLKELEQIIEILEKSAGENGSLEKAVADAQAGLMGPNNKTKQAIANELSAQVRSDRSTLAEKQRAYADAVSAHLAAKQHNERLVQQKADLEEDQKTLEQQQKTLTEKQAELAEQQKALDAERTALREKLKTAFSDDPASVPSTDLPPRQILSFPDNQSEDASELVEVVGPDGTVFRIPVNGFDSDSLNLPPAIQQQLERMELESSIKTLELRTTILQDQRSAVDAELEQVNTDLEQTKADLKQLETDIPASEDAVKAAKETINSATEEIKPAEEALKKSEAEAAAARDAANEAQSALTDAELALKKGSDQLKRLQNSKTNLSLRAEKTVKAQKGCTEQHDKCKAENDKVQAATDEQEIFNGYKTVQGLSKDTCYYERQVRETAQYMSSARKLADSTKKEFPETAGAGADTGAETDSGAKSGSNANTNNGSDSGSANPNGEGQSANGPGVYHS